MANRTYAGRKVQTRLCKNDLCKRGGTKAKPGRARFKIGRGRKFCSSTCRNAYKSKLYRRRKVVNKGNANQTRGVRVPDSGNTAKSAPHNLLKIKAFSDTKSAVSTLIGPRIDPGYQTPRAVAKLYHQAPDPDGKTLGLYAKVHPNKLPSSYNVEKLRERIAKRDGMVSRTHMKLLTRLDDDIAHGKRKITWDGFKSRVKSILDVPADVPRKNVDDERCLAVKTLIEAGGLTPSGRYRELCVDDVIGRSCLGGVIGRPSLDSAAPATYTRDRWGYVHRDRNRRAHQHANPKSHLYNPAYARWLEGRSEAAINHAA